uniref:Uncharacterized protein n=1 Tax=Junco hyemalis TaxID=40217 RepID=A0A8C5NJC9_JUNHY
MPAPRAPTGPAPQPHGGRAGGSAPGPAEDGKWRVCTGIVLLTQIAVSILDSFCHVRSSVLGFLLGLVQFFCLSPHWQDGCWGSLVFVQLCGRLWSSVRCWYFTVCQGDSAHCNADQTVAHITEAFSGEKLQIQHFEAVPSADKFTVCL